VVIREVLVGGAMAIATLVFKMRRFDVTLLGKAATFLLMFAIPGFMLGSSWRAARARDCDR
jgi:cardiolipin synthase